MIRVLSRSEWVRPALDRDGASFALPLIAQLCDRLSIEHRDDATGTAVVMHFDLGRRPDGGDGALHRGGEHRGRAPVA